MVPRLLNPRLVCSVFTKLKLVKQLLLSTTVASLFVMVLQSIEITLGPRRGSSKNRCACSSSWMLKNVAPLGTVWSCGWCQRSFPDRRSWTPTYPAFFECTARVCQFWCPCKPPSFRQHSAYWWAKWGGIVLWTCQKEGRACGSGQCCPPSGSYCWSGQVFVALWNAILTWYKPLGGRVTHRPSNLPEREIQKHPYTAKLSENPQFQQLCCWQMPHLYAEYRLVCSVIYSIIWSVKILMKHAKGIWTASGTMKTGLGAVKVGMSFLTPFLWLYFAGVEGFW